MGNICDLFVAWKGRWKVMVEWLISAITVVFLICVLVVLVGIGIAIIGFIITSIMDMWM